MGQKLCAVRAFPLRIGIRKVHPDVAQRRRAQQCIRDRVRKNIGVGVALQTKIGSHRDTAENERAPRGETMNVPAQPGPDHDAVSPASSSARNNLARSMSVGFVILRLRSLPCTTLTSTCSSRSTKLDSSVPMNPSCRAI